MQALASPQRVPVTAASSYSTSSNPRTIWYWLSTSTPAATQVLDSSSGTVNWTVPRATGKSFCPAPSSAPAHALSHNQTGAKDGTHSLMDYLNPEADKLFVEWTFDATAAVGDELGRRSWASGRRAGLRLNPCRAALAEFQKRKGYDLRPYLAKIASIGIGARIHCTSQRQSRREPPCLCGLSDVWSDLFGENFFGMEGMGAENGVEMQTHIENEESCRGSPYSDGDFFKCMRGIQVPGVDTSGQIWHDVVADFPSWPPRGASERAPRAMASFCGYNPQPDFKEAGDSQYLLVNGISRIEYMGMAEQGRAAAFTAIPAFLPSPPM